MAVERVSAKRYGVRYGRKLREKVGKIDQSRIKSTGCPYCNYNKAKRLAAGIWYCNKCEAKFTGRAYTIGFKATESPEQKEADDQKPEQLEEEVLT